MKIQNAPQGKICGNEIELPEGESESSVRTSLGTGCLGISVACNLDMLLEVPKAFELAQRKLSRLDPVDVSGSTYLGLLIKNEAEAVGNALTDLLKLLAKILLSRNVLGMYAVYSLSLEIPRERVLVNSACPQSYDITKQRKR